MRRVARGRLDSAVERLRDPDADEVEAIHEARKDLKKLRSTLRLVRPVVGEEVYQRENERYRDASRRLSETRDAQVLAETIDSLEHGFADQPPPGGWGRSGTRSRPAKQTTGRRSTGCVDERRPRSRPAAERSRACRSPATGSTSSARGCAARTRAAVSGWPRRRRSPATSACTSGASAARTSGITFASCDPPGGRCSSRSPTRHASSPTCSATTTTWCVLESRIAETDIPLSDDQRRDLGELIARRRAELQAQAFALGERLYAEKPKAFARRIGAYWEAARA